MLGKHEVWFVAKHADQHHSRAERPRADRRLDDLTGIPEVNRAKLPNWRRYTQNPDKGPPRWLESVDERFVLFIAGDTTRIRETLGIHLCRLAGTILVAINYVWLGKTAKGVVAVISG